MYLSIDIGGTSTRIAVFDKSPEIRTIEKYPTPQNYSEAIELLFQKIQELISNERITAISIGVPGVVTKDHELISASHLQEWVGQPLYQDFVAEFNVPIFLQNDTDLGGLGEAAYGAGQNAEIVAYLAIGTGFGGARIVNNKIDEQVFGFEPGHIIIQPFDDTSDSFPHQGSLESFVSGTALVEKYNIKRTSECNDPEIWNEVGEYLAIGLVNILLLWSPEVVVLGGGVIINAGERLLQPMKYHLKQRMQVTQIPKIVVAELGDEANLIGGYYHIINQL